MKQPLSPAKLLERDVTRQIKDFLEWRGWRPIRFQRTVVPGQFQTGEPGIPDFLFVRYLNTEFAGLAVTLWVEMKRPKYGKVLEDQKKWHARERARGAIVLKADNVAEFEQQYYKRVGWVHTEDWVQGQQEIGFAALSKSELQAVTR